MFSRITLLALLASAVVFVRGDNVGDGTFFQPALGACGVVNSASDSIVAVSADLFDTFPGAGANPNDNPVCFKQIRATFQGKSVTATVTDKCAGCPGFDDLDMSPAVFDPLASESVGRIHGVHWSFV